MKQNDTKASLHTRRKVLIASFTLCVALADALDAQDNSPKPATGAAKRSNTEWLQRLDFADKQDFEDARAGFIEGLPDGGVVKNEKGDIVWDPTKFDFIDPGKANPSLWRISQLLSMGGIFKIAPKICQARGYDLSVITFIEGRTGVIVVDPLVSAETAAASLKLYRKAAGDKPVTAVIHTHSHVDHFGGVRGVTNEAGVKAGGCLIAAPEHFIEEAVSENVLAGKVMSRRASHMYGNVVPRGPQGTPGAGLGTTTSSGTVTLIEPTNIIRKTGDKLTVDGLNFEFLMASENGIIPDTRISGARHSKGGNSPARSPDEILLRFRAVKEPSAGLPVRESVHVLLMDTDRRFSLSGGASGLVVSADTSGTSARLIITTRKTLLALLNRPLPVKEALESGLLLNEPTALQQRSWGDAPAPPLFDASHAG